ncbi:phage tail length tape measure family protein, partial [Staphylococcus aureus]
AQFQDIGVTTAMGMSPIQIALQQGTQLSAVFNDLKRDGQSVGATLAGAFASVVSPISLVTIGVIAAGAAAFQYFSTVMTEGDKSAEV